jgi:DNA gyrase/topoisomerase IV subunit A
MADKTTPSLTPTSDYIKDSSREYSVYVCENRAIPKVADGMKDGPRKAMWLMRSKAEKIKTVSLAGEMISSGLYLHGDKSAADSISMLAAPYVNNIPLLDGIGAFGTRVAPVEGIGAPRYTYVKKSKASEMLLFHDLAIVPMKDNYDGSNQEPVHFLPLIPMVLLNGTAGIAVGWSTDILPRNLKKLVNATQQVLEGKEPKGLEPSFDYLNVQVKNLEPNVWQFSGRCEILDTSSCRIVELPPGLNLEGMKKRLNKLEEDGKIQTYTDKSTSLISIIVKFKRGEIKSWTEEDAIAFFKLREKATERIVVVDWNGSRIRQYESAAEVVKEFVTWRLGWYTTRYQKMLADDSYELKYWQGIKACFDDKLPERLGKKADKAGVVTEVETITAAIGLDATQTDRIVSLPTYRWAKDFLAIVKENIARLQGNIKEYKAILKSPTRIKEIYASELDDLKKLK